MKKSIGRPRKGSEVRDHLIHARVPKALWDRLDDFAKQEGKSRSDMINRALDWTLPDLLPKTTTVSHCAELRFMFLPEEPE